MNINIPITCIAGVLTSGEAIKKQESASTRVEQMPDSAMKIKPKGNSANDRSNAAPDEANELQMNLSVVHIPQTNAGESSAETGKMTPGAMESSQIEVNDIVNDYNNTAPDEAHEPQMNLSVVEIPQTSAGEPSAENGKMTPGAMESSQIEVNDISMVPHLVMDLESNGNSVNDRNSTVPGEACKLQTVSADLQSLSTGEVIESHSAVELSNVTTSSVSMIPVSSKADTGKQDVEEGSWVEVPLAYVAYDHGNIDTVECSSNAIEQMSVSNSALLPARENVVPKEMPKGYCKPNVVSASFSGFTSKQPVDLSALSLIHI